MQKPNFHLRTHCEVLEVLKDRSGERATGVRYVDAQGKLWEQPAEIVILCGYQLSNARLMMLSGIGEIYNPQTGEGLVGKNYTYQVMSGVDVFFDDAFTNEFIGAGALGMVVDDYNGDNWSLRDLCGLKRGPSFVSTPDVVVVTQGAFGAETSDIAAPNAPGCLVAGCFSGMMGAG